VINVNIKPNAIINCNNYIYNIKKIVNYIGKDTLLMLVVKSDAYGHGAVKMARTANSVGVFNYGVATIDEAVELRKNKILGEILILGHVHPKDYSKVCKYDLTITISDKFNPSRIPKNNIIKAHIKIDTGMSRHGFYIHDEKDIEGVFSEVYRLSCSDNLLITGIYTHFATSDNDSIFLHKQIDIFNKFIYKLKVNDVKYGKIHAANSAATIKYKESHYDMVRVGLLSYGLSPYNQDIFNPKPVMELKAYIIQIKYVNSGDYIGYNNTFKVLKGMKLAIVNIGYADGILRSLSNKGFVLINGKRASIIGLISMDVMIVDVSHIDVKLYDEVVIFGYSNGSYLSISQVSIFAKTIEYEILCAIGNRVERIYKD